MTNTDNDPSKKQNKTFLLNLGAWPRSYANPIEETKKKLIRNKWKEIPSCTVKEQTYCFEKQSKELYLHFLGFAIVTGPYDMDIDDVIQNCGKKWISNTAIYWKQPQRRELEDSDWKETVALKMMDIMLTQLKDWADGPVIGGQVNGAGHLLLQCQRVYELFPPIDSKKYRDDNAVAVGLIRKIRRNSAMEFKSSKAFAAAEVIKNTALPVCTFFAGSKAWVAAGAALGLYLFAEYVLKTSKVDETPISPIPDEDGKAND